MQPHRVAEAMRVVEPRSLTVRSLGILWPAFVMAGVLEGLLFVVVDPATLRWFGEQPLALSNSAVYSLTFMIMWGVMSVASAITVLLEMPAP